MKSKSVKKEQCVEMGFRPTSTGSGKNLNGDLKWPEPEFPPHEPDLDLGNYMGGMSTLPTSVWFAIPSS
jgi:hypothetical protein